MGSGCRDWYKRCLLEQETGQWGTMVILKEVDQVWYGLATVTRYSVIYVLRFPHLCPMV